MNSFDQGYVAQLKGAFGDGAPAVHFMSEKEAAAYRAGARTCRADLAAEADAKEVSRTTGKGPEGIPDWARRLTEFRGTPTLQAEIEERDNPPRMQMTPVATPFAYDEPVPGVKKTKKQKPADENQGSLFG